MGAPWRQLSSRPTPPPPRSRGRGTERDGGGASAAFVEVGRVLGDALGAREYSARSTLHSTTAKREVRGGGGRRRILTSLTAKPSGRRGTG